jgi:hypothetical protein
MSQHCVLSSKPQLRLEWRGQDGQSEREQPDHSASLGDSITSSTRMRFSAHTGGRRSFGTMLSRFAAMDLFVVPTISFRLLYGLLIMGHGRRQIL